MQDIKHYKTSWQAKLWHTLFGEKPIVWKGKVNMSKEKLALQQRIATLEKQLKTAEACQIHGLHFASQAIKKVSVDKIHGSGVILQLSYLNGEGVFSPIMIANGLSNETIEYLIKDMKRSFEYSTELKP